MINPLNYASNFIKNKSVDSNLFKYGKYVPFLGTALHIAKHFSLRSEIYSLPLQGPDAQENQKNFKLAAAKFKDMSDLANKMRDPSQLSTNGLMSGLIVSKLIFATVFKPMMVGLVTSVLVHSITEISMYQVNQYLDKYRSPHTKSLSAVYSSSLKS